MRWALAAIRWLLLVGATASLFAWLAPVHWFPPERDPIRWSSRCATLYLEPGGVILSLSWGPYHSDHYSGEFVADWEGPRPPRRIIGVPRVVNGTDLGILIIDMPYWLLLVVTSTLGLFLTVLRYCRLWHRFPQTCCRMCGCDLTGNISGICPECGVPHVKHALGNSLDVADIGQRQGLV